MKSGLGEMLHYFIVSGKEDFDLYRSLYNQVYIDKAALSKIISRSLEIKKSYIEVDEFDMNVRQVFNFGHSFGHAIESLTKYAIPHGIAVSFGIDMANFISVKLGYIPTAVREEIREVVAKIWDGYSIRTLDVKLFRQALGKDKKNVGNKLGLILNKGYGNIFKTVMEAGTEFDNWLLEYFENETN
jgi:3-dehydroquinate synthase